MKKTPIILAHCLKVMNIPSVFNMSYLVIWGQITTELPMYYLVSGKGAAIEGKRTLYFGD